VSLKPHRWAYRWQILHRQWKNYIFIVQRTWFVQPIVSKWLNRCTHSSGNNFWNVHYSTIEVNFKFDLVKKQQFSSRQFNAFSFCCLKMSNRINVSRLRELKAVQFGTSLWLHYPSLTQFNYQLFLFQPLLIMLRTKTGNRLRVQRTSGNVSY